MRWLWGRIGVALGWLADYSALRTRAALPGLSVYRFQLSGFIPHPWPWMFVVNHKHSEYNPILLPPSGWSGGTLVLSWHLPIPIEPPPNAIFDQASLSTSPSRSIPSSAQFRFACCRDTTPSHGSIRHQCPLLAVDEVTWAKRVWFQANKS